MDRRKILSSAIVGVWPYLGPYKRLARYDLASHGQIHLTRLRIWPSGYIVTGGFQGRVTVFKEGRCSFVEYGEEESRVGQTTENNK